jgi:glutamate racemase
VPQRDLPIAMFDSGVGGLTVLHECLVSLPHEDFVYLGDTARFPYGVREADELRAFAFELAELLLAEGAKLLVVACNAATSAALPALRERFGRVVGVVTPESQLAARATKNGHVGLLATPATVASGAYERALEGVTLHAVACPELAPLIQAGEVDQRLVDSVILGCTHYPLVRPIIQRALGRGVRIVSSGQAIADAVHSALDGMDNGEQRRGSYRFLCTGDPEEFRRVGTRFLQMPLGEVEQVNVHRRAVA